MKNKQKFAQKNVPFFGQFSGRSEQTFAFLFQLAKLSGKTARLPLSVSFAEEFFCNHVFQPSLPGSAHIIVYQLYKGFSTLPAARPGKPGSYNRALKSAVKLVISEDFTAI